MRIVRKVFARAFMAAPGREAGMTVKVKDEAGARCVKITHYEQMTMPRYLPGYALWPILSDAGWPGVVVPRRPAYYNRWTDVFTGDIYFEFQP